MLDRRGNTRERMSAPADVTQGVRRTGPGAELLRAVGGRDDWDVSDDCGQLRRSFDSAADLYQRARPEYPEALQDALIEAAGLHAGDRLLEIGCATVKATLPLARRGFHITCVELGPALASAARRNLSGFPDVEVVETAFETFDRPKSDRFDTVFAATAWHSLDPSIRYQRAWELLVPGGHLAFWSATHVFSKDGDPFFAELQEVYDEIGEGRPEGAVFPRPGEQPDERQEIERSGLFDDVVVRHVDWEVVYDVEGYLALLDTFSGHISMQPWQRDRLYSEIRRRLGKRSDGKVRRGWGAVLHVASRRDAPAVP